MWCLLAAFALFLLHADATAHPLEKGLVISDPRIIAALEKKRFSVEFFAPRGKGGADAACARIRGGSNSPNPFQSKPLCSIAESIITAIGQAQTNSLDRAGKAADERSKLDTAFFADPESTIQLVGVVNRMDRAYRPSRSDGSAKAGNNPAPETCGEIRFIYRFGYDDEVGGEVVRSRLPLTLNVVVDARRGDQSRLSCASIAKRWAEFRATHPDDVVDTQAEAERIADILLAPGGPLELITPRNLDRFETNTQIMRVSAGSKRDFGTHAEYLLQVFNLNRRDNTFVAAPLENQIKPGLGASSPADFKDRLKLFKQRLLSTSVLNDLDRGTMVFRDDYKPGRPTFLAKSAVSIAPGGESRSQNNPYSAVIGTSEECADPAKKAGLLCPDEIRAALEKHLRNKGSAQYIATEEGFLARLRDSTCTGCHQSRAIAGFHFPGADRPSENPDEQPNRVFVPGSAHFFADLPRRARVLDDMASGKPIKAIDFSRGFAARPDKQYQTALAQTALYDGWGTACHLNAAGEPNHSAFKSWTCGDGLECKPYMPSDLSPNRGICLTKGAPGVGDPLEWGVVTRGPLRDIGAARSFAQIPAAPTTGLPREPYGSDKYTRLNPNRTQGSDSSRFEQGDALAARLKIPTRAASSNWAASQQPYYEPQKSGGFPGGMLRTSCCQNVPAGASCGLVAVSGFNDCLNDAGVPFTQCVKFHTSYAALRACDVANPCREDYICLEPLLGRNGSIDDVAKLRPLPLATGRPARRGRISPDDRCEVPDKSWATTSNKGVCLPPYFVFQFRADKQRASFQGELPR